MNPLVSNTSLPYICDDESELLMPGAWIDSVSSPLQFPGSPAIIMPESQPGAQPAGDKKSRQVLTPPSEQPLANEVSSASNSPHPQPVTEPLSEASVAVDSPQSHAPVTTESLSKENPFLLAHPPESQPVQNSSMPLGSMPPDSTVKPLKPQPPQKSSFPTNAPKKSPESQPGKDSTAMLSPEEKVQSIVATVMCLAEEALSKYPTLQTIRQGERENCSTDTDADEDSEVNDSDMVSSIVKLIGVYIFSAN